MTWTTLNVRLDTVATKLQSLSSSADEVSSKIQDAELRLEQLKNAPIGTDYAATRGLGPAEPAGPSGITYPGTRPKATPFPVGTDYAAIRGLGPAGPAGPGGASTPLPFIATYKPFVNAPTPSNPQAWADFMIAGQQQLNGGWITNDLKTLIEDRAFGRTNNADEIQRQQRGISDADIRNTDARLAELNRRRS